MRPAEPGTRTSARSSSAERELRRRPLSDDDSAFLRSFGETLAGVMLYGGNSYLEPNDDAPRVADILSNPNDGRHLHVGVGRPRAVYVLYPYEGRDVLCRGAVLPYFESLGTTRLTDEDWRALLGSAEAPSPPEWLMPIVGTHVTALQPAD